MTTTLREASSAQKVDRQKRGIFISYRRDDTEGQAGRLFQDLSDVFGPEMVFMDVAGIQPGIDFRRAIEQQTASCGVLLALIGRTWLTVTHADGKRRLDDVNDVVRFETASALRRDIPVIPVLLQGSRMPRPEDLPDDLKELAFRNSVEITHARWDSDVHLLIKALQSFVPRPESTPTQGASRAHDIPEIPLAATESSAAGRSIHGKGKWGVIAAALAFLIVIGGGWMAYERWQSDQRERAARLAAEQRIARDEAAAKVVADKAAAERNEIERAQSLKIAAAEKAASERAAAEKAAVQRAAAAQAETSRKALAEKVALQRAAEETAVADRLNSERAAAEKVAADKAVADRAVANRTAAAERAAADRAAANRAAAAATAAADARSAQMQQHRDGNCVQGFVWRDARAGDKVCVTPAVRAQSANENRSAAANRQPGGGAYGPNTCKQGFVWREAFSGDVVCVVPASRSQAASDNAAASRRVVPLPR